MAGTERPILSFQNEIEELGYKLERFHGVFYEIWSVSSFYESKKIPTAAVGWNKKTQQTLFLVNPDFWNKLDEYTKLFIISHEMLHLVLRHPKRTIEQKLDRMKANIAQDICVNETLVRDFGFYREKLCNNLDKEMVWYDTVKFDVDPIDKDREFEYYYNHLVFENQKSIDSHEFWEDLPEGELEKVLEKMSPEDLEDLKEKIKKAGTDHLDKIINVQKTIKFNNRWKTLFKHWSMYVEDDQDNWRRPNRRINSKDIIIPSDYEEETKLEKGQVWLFLDVSGSCVHLAQEFYNVANSIPTKHFEVKMFCFDTEVTGVSKDRLRGGGGTSFACIENFIRGHKQYPAAVFVITDGQGDQVHPKHPKRWYWFLSEECLDYIPPKSNKFKLQDLSKI